MIHVQHLHLVLFLSMKQYVLAQMDMLELQK